MKKEDVLKNLERLKSDSVHKSRGLLEMLEPKIPPVDVERLIPTDLDVVTLTAAIEIIESATVPVYCYECAYRKELLNGTNIRLFCGSIQCGVTNPEVDPMDYCSRGVKEVKENEG